MLSFFFFKQKTAYELRISDWSSDVCSSDLAQQPLGLVQIEPTGRLVEQQHPRVVGERPGDLDHLALVGCERADRPARIDLDPERVEQQNGRASCRARVCQYV